MSIFEPVSRSLTATGCRLSVGELAGRITSTFSRTKERRISIRTCSVVPRMDVERCRLGVGKSFPVALTR
jgi:hypothetical protein